MVNLRELVRWMEAGVGGVLTIKDWSSLPLLACLGSISSFIIICYLFFHTICHFSTKYVFPYLNELYLLQPLTNHKLSEIYRYFFLYFWKESWLDFMSLSHHFQVLVNLSFKKKILQVQISLIYKLQSFNLKFLLCSRVQLELEQERKER